VKGFREAAEDRIASLIARVEELRGKQFPTPASERLLDVIQNIVQAIPAQLDRYHLRLQGNPDAFRRSGGHLTKLLGQLHELTFLVNETSRAKTPAALVSSLRDVVRLHTGSNVDLLFRPDSQGLQYTYLGLDRWIDEVLTNAADFIDRPIAQLAAPLASEIVVLSYPAAERNNVMLHSIFLHELGHHITYINGAIDRIFSTRPVPNALAQADLTDVCENWVSEFAADFAAARIVGPAYVFGIYRTMLGTEVLDAYGRTHPPSFLRIRTLLRYLEREGFTKCLPDRVRGHLEGWEPDLAAADRRCRDALIGEDPVLQQLFGYIEGLVPEIDSAVVESMPHAFTSERYVRECIPLAAQLGEFMPLNEWYNADDDSWHTASLAGILNAGWNFSIGDIEAFYGRIGAVTDTERREARRRVFDLVGKSIEFAQIQHDIMARETSHPNPAEGGVS
jgi:hypothetical protein